MKKREEIKTRQVTITLTDDEIQEIENRIRVRANMILTQMDRPDLLDAVLYKLLRAVEDDAAQQP